jgi:hypothetical protein
VRARVAMCQKAAALAALKGAKRDERTQADQVA